jgi:D-alanyl-lipoteichoic acid acyltransferase DltB (MBOAT superfamily)
LLFNSVEFFVFLAIVYSLYRLLPFRGQNWLLLIAGYVFYGWWDTRFLFLIAFSTTVDFWIGSMLGRGRVPQRQRMIASAFILSAALLFLNLDWPALGRGVWQAAWAPTQLGLSTVAGTAVVVILANFTHARIAAMNAEARRRLLLFVTVGVNLGFLGIFKYCNFFIATARPALVSLGLDPDRFHLDVVLPVGISFYTFQSLSYTLDAARGRVKPVRRFWDFALFVAFFPPMVAGPIERARHLLPQLLRPRRIRLAQSMHGVVLILLGLFKKVAIADGLAPAVNTVYNSSGVVSGSDVALATLLFAFQILCDFSGYSDIARGVAKLLGIELMVNFDLPYISRNPSEFWRRWHISLSSWLRDYLYISLGGNRKGEFRTYVNLMVTMLLGGLWHGAAPNYVLWGGYQGVLLCTHRALTGKRQTLPTGAAAVTNHAPGRYAYLRAGAGTFVSIAVFFLFMCYGWLLFRAHSWDQITTFSAALAGYAPSVPSVIPKPPLAALAGLALFIPLQLIEWHDGRRECFRFWPRPLQGALYAAFLFILAMGTSNAPAQFIYFQF